MYKKRLENYYMQVGKYAIDVTKKNGMIRYVVADTSIEDVVMVLSSRFEIICSKLANEDAKYVYNLVYRNQRLLERRAKEV